MNSAILVVLTDIRGADLNVEDKDSERTSP